MQMPEGWQRLNKLNPVTTPVVVAGLDPLDAVMYMAHVQNAMILMKEMAEALEAVTTQLGHKDSISIGLSEVETLCQDTLKKFQQWK